MSEPAAKKMKKTKPSKQKRASRSLGLSDDDSEDIPKTTLQPDYDDDEEVIGTQKPPPISADVGLKRQELNEDQKELAKKMLAQSPDKAFPVVSGPLAIYNGLTFVDGEVTVTNKAGGPLEEAQFLEGPKAFYLQPMVNGKRFAFVLFGSMNAAREQVKFQVFKAAARLYVDNVSSEDLIRFQGNPKFTRVGSDEFEEFESVASSVENSWIYKLLEKSHSKKLAEKACSNKRKVCETEDEEAKHRDLAIRKVLGKPSEYEPFNKDQTNYEWIKDKTGFAHKSIKIRNPATGEDEWKTFAGGFGDQRITFDFELPLDQNGSWNNSLKAPDTIIKIDNQTGERIVASAEDVKKDFLGDNLPKKQVMLTVTFDTSINSRQPAPTVRGPIVKSMVYKIDGDGHNMSIDEIHRMMVV